VYFTPLVGGMIADRWIGQRNAVVTGALLMSSGHLVMTSDETFLLRRAVTCTWVAGGFDAKAVGGALPTMISE
jgi:dipeptide/tripeptide permease